VKVLEQRHFMVSIEEQMFVFKAKRELHLRPKPEYGNMFNPDPVVSTVPDDHPEIVGHTPA